MQTYHAGVRLPAFGSSPQYLSEFISYLYVGGKFRRPSDHPSKARPFLNCRVSCQDKCQCARVKFWNLTE